MGKTAKHAPAALFGKKTKQSRFGQRAGETQPPDRAKAMLHAAGATGLATNVLRVVSEEVRMGEVQSLVAYGFPEVHRDLMMNPIPEGTLETIHTIFDRARAGAPLQTAVNHLVAHLPVDSEMYVPVYGISALLRRCLATKEALEYAVEALDRRCEQLGGAYHLGYVFSSICRNYPPVIQPVLEQIVVTAARTNWGVIAVHDILMANFYWGPKAMALAVDNGQWFPETDWDDRRTRLTHSLRSVIASVVQTLLDALPEEDRGEEGVRRVKDLYGYLSAEPQISAAPFDLTSLRQFTSDYTRDHNDEEEMDDD